jgi:hypothetical protein
MPPDRGFSGSWLPTNRIWPLMHRPWQPFLMDHVPLQGVRMLCGKACHVASVKNLALAGIDCGARSCGLRNRDEPSRLKRGKRIHHGA